MEGTLFHNFYDRTLCARMYRILAVFLVLTQALMECGEILTSTTVGHGGYLSGAC